MRESAVVPAQFPALTATLDGSPHADLLPVGSDRESARAAGFDRCYGQHGCHGRDRSRRRYGANRSHRRDGSDRRHGSDRSERNQWFDGPNRSGWANRAFG